MPRLRERDVSIPVTMCSLNMKANLLQSSFSTFVSLPVACAIYILLFLGSAGSLRSEVLVDDAACFAQQPAAILSHPQQGLIYAAQAGQHTVHATQMIVVIHVLLTE